MGLDHAIGDASPILLDTSALIAFHNQNEPVHPLARHLMRRIETEGGKLVGYYSVISAAELLVRPARASDVAFTFMHTFLTTFPHLTVLPMDLTVATQSATIRAVSNLRLPDAVVIASGLLAGCESIVTNDRSWKQRLEPLFGGFRWVYLGDFA